jgi:CAAX protease family protein
MRQRFFAPLIDGPARYQPETNWGPIAAILAVIGIFVVSSVIVGLAAVAVEVVRGILTGGEPKLAADFMDLKSFDGQLFLATQQAVMIAMTVLAAYMIQGRPSGVLALKPLPKGTVPPSVFVQIGVSMAYTAVIIFIAKDELFADVGPFAKALQGENWLLLALVVTVGAPLSEELMFRGFLFSALAKTRLGIIGTTLVTNTAWTALHFQYSIFGLIDVFLVGLVLSWLLWRTGSLWVTIICHSVYNSIVLLGIWVAISNGWLPVN